VSDWNDRKRESWVVHVGGDVVEKEAAEGWAALSSLEKLIFCLWVADYGMRNAGDLETAADVYEPFQREAASLALELDAPYTLAAFSLPTAELERRYLELFSDIVDELKARRDALGG
jgi:hypothetical protein